MLKTIFANDANEIQDEISQLEKTGKTVYLDSIVFEKKLVVFVGYNPYEIKQNKVAGK